MDSIEAIIQELTHGLPTSLDSDRRVWAEKIIREDVSLVTLTPLLLDDEKVALRFTWLLSDIGRLSREKLFEELTQLFEFRKHVTLVDFELCFASYWNVCGVPEENEAEAINLLFDWLQSSQVNVTMKSRALSALQTLIEKFPELKNELKFCLEDQLDRNTESFRKRAMKVLEVLNR